MPDDVTMTAVDGRDALAHVVTDASDDPEHADDCPGCEVERLRAELAARPPRAEVLREAADELEADDHLMAAADLREMADEAAGEGGDGRG